MGRRSERPGDSVRRGTAEGRIRTLLVGLALVALAVLPYATALDHPLLHDDRTLLDNAWLARESGIVSALRHDYWFGTRHAGSDLYRPMTVVTLAWNLRWAPRAEAFRGVNVALHAIVAVLVWWTLAGVLRRIPGPAGSSERDPRSGSIGAVGAAWIGAAVFAVHPLTSEAVMLAVGRAELLAATFGLSAFLAVLVGERRRSNLGLAASAALLALALLSKESAAAWLVILPLWWLISRPERAARARCALTYTGWLAVFIGFVGARAMVVGWRPHAPPWVDNPLVLESPATRIANAVVVQGLYLLKMAFPFRLSVEHGFDQMTVLPFPMPGLVAAAAVVAGWSAVAVVAYRRSRAAAFLWAFVPAAFVVTANLALPIGTMFAERLAYLPLVGACGVLACVVSRLPARRLPVAVLLAVLIASAAARTVVRTRDYESHATFVEATAAASPRAIKALANVGRNRLRLGRPADAVEPLERAVTLWPDYARALRLLAETYDALGDARTASDYRERARRAASATDPPLR